mmetsp:Transcript_149002/g.285461  ORF Transcript_149002/g.285461 Transcript_149002/m.285461 type:complete len:535 (+) Transcript_149002:116-1720(+)
MSESKSTLAVATDLPWKQILSAVGGFSLLYVWNQIRTPSFLQDLVTLTHSLGPPKVLQWLKVEQAKKLAERKPFDDYDVVVRLESVLDMNDADAGCAILGCSSDVFEQPLSVRTVAVLGLYNTGKSFLQSRLFGFNFPQGPLQRTAGLSFKYVESSNLLIVDSAGNLEPVSTESWSLEDAVRDRKDVEMMVKELGIKMADVLIVTVNDITWPEQEFVQSLMQRCVQRPRKCLIVLHNMKHIFDPEIAKARFNEHLSQMYQGKQVKDILGGENALEFVHRDEATDLVVNHFGIANQFSPAGQKFNEGALRRIRAVIDFHDRIGSKRCMKTIFETFGTSMLPQFFYCDDDAATCKMRLEFEPLQGEPEPHQGTNYIGGLFVKQPDEEVVHWRHRTRASNEGPTYLDSLPTGTDFKPDYSIYIETRKGNQEFCHLQIEAPGCVSSDLEVEDVGEGLLVTINKTRRSSDTITKVVEESRKYSSWKHLFTYKIPGCGVYGPPSDEQKGVYIHDGEFHILLPKAVTMGSLNVKQATNGRW